jgi:hypothetical protein
MSKAQLQVVQPHREGRVQMAKKKLNQPIACEQLPSNAEQEANEALT